MSPSKVTFLGTGTSQGIPMIACDCTVCESTDERDKRLRVSIHVEIGGKSFIIDTGPDFRQQVLRAGIKRLDAVLYTHEHKDHTAGMDDLRGFNYHQQATIPLYARAQVIEQLKREFAYAFGENKYPGAPSVSQVVVKNNETFHVKDQEVVPINAYHGNLQVFGYKIGGIVYLTDVKTIDISEIDKIKGCEILVINCLREEPHNTHFNLDEALEFISLVQPKKTYLTHISHLFGFHEEIQAKLPENIYVAYDNLKLTI